MGSGERPPRIPLPKPSPATPAPPGPTPTSAQRLSFTTSPLPAEPALSHQLEARDSESGTQSSTSRLQRGPWPGPGATRAKSLSRAPGLSGDTEGSERDSFPSRDPSSGAPSPLLRGLLQSDLGPFPGTSPRTDGRWRPPAPTHQVLPTSRP